MSNKNIFAKYGSHSVREIYLSAEEIILNHPDCIIEPIESRDDEVRYEGKRKLAFSVVYRCHNHCGMYYFTKRYLPL